MQVDNSKKRRRLYTFVQTSLLAVFLVANILIWTGAYRDIPNYVDYSISYVCCDISILNRDARDAELRIGERGAIDFIQQGLMSRKWRKAYVSGFALDSFREHHEKKTRSQEMFKFLLDYLINERYPEGANIENDGSMAYGTELLRGGVISYLYYYGFDLYTVENKRDLLDLYYNHLTNKEKDELYEYMVRRDTQWFLRNDPTLGD